MRYTHKANSRYKVVHLNGQYIQQHYIVLFMANCFVQTYIIIKNIYGYSVSQAIYLVYL
jgi:hypothetical protein